MKKYRLGITGIGRGFSLMIPTLKLHPNIEVVAGVDPNELARNSFEIAFDKPTYSHLEGMLSAHDIDAVYVASPHQYHVEDVLLCLERGKVVLCEKPMAIDLESALKIVHASNSSGIPVIVGPSHSFDAPILQTAQLIASQEFGSVKMLQMMNYTDFIYRPRRGEELDVKQGGGVVFSQAAHQIDIARLLCGGVVKQVNARTGNFDANRSTIGAYSAQLDFDKGVFASLTYSGYGHYDSDEMCGAVSELGFYKKISNYAGTRKELDRQSSLGLSENQMKAQSTQNKIQRPFELPNTHEHFGFVMVSCEKADIRPLSDRIIIYAEYEKREIPVVPPKVPRQFVIDELIFAIEGKPILHCAQWGLATVECILALNASAQSQKIEVLLHQMEVTQDCLKALI